MLYCPRGPLTSVCTVVYSQMWLQNSISIYVGQGEKGKGAHILCVSTACMPRWHMISSVCTVVYSQMWLHIYLRWSERKRERRTHIYVSTACMPWGYLISVCTVVYSQMWLQNSISIYVGQGERGKGAHIYVFQLAACLDGTWSAASALLSNVITYLSTLVREN